MTHTTAPAHRLLPATRAFLEDSPKKLLIGGEAFPTLNPAIPMVPGSSTPQQSEEVH